MVGNQYSGARLFVERVFAYQMTDQLISQLAYPSYEHEHNRVLLGVHGSIVRDDLIIVQ